MQWLGDDATPSWLRLDGNGAAARASVSSAAERDFIVFDAAVPPPFLPASVVDSGRTGAENECANVAAPPGAEHLKMGPVKVQPAPAASLTKEQTRQYNRWVGRRL